MTMGFLLINPIDCLAQLPECVHNDDHEEKFSQEEDVDIFFLKLIFALKAVEEEFLQELQARENITIDGSTSDIFDESHYLEEVRGKKISVAKVIFALKVGQEVITTAIKVAELYKQEKQAEKERAEQDKK